MKPAVMADGPKSRRCAALRLDRRYDMIRRIALVCIAFALVAFGYYFLQLATAGGAIAANSRSVFRSSLILCAGLAIVVGSISVLLRDARIVPAAVAFNVGGVLIVVAMSVRRPILKARQGDAVVVSSSVHTSTHVSPLLGRVAKTYYKWSIASGDRRAEWTAGDPLPKLLAREWTARLQAVGFSGEATSEADWGRV